MLATFVGKSHLVPGLVTHWPELGHRATPMLFIRRWQGEEGLEVEGGSANKQQFAREHLLKLKGNQNFWVCVSGGLLFM